MVGFLRKPLSRGLVVAAVLASVTMLTGCTSGHRKVTTETPTSIPIDFGTLAPSPTPIPSPSDGKRHRYEQKQVPAPTTAQGAILAASAAVDADQNATLKILELKIPGESVPDFETGKWLVTMSEFINEWGDQESPPAISGPAPVWLRDAVATWVTPLRVGVQTYEYGRVEMLGCFRNGGYYLNQSDGAAYDASGHFHRYQPYSVSVQYNPPQQVWLVADETYLTPTTGAPKCPPAGW